jgi:hypothetical protein
MARAGCMAKRRLVKADGCGSLVKKQKNKELGRFAVL